MSARQWMTTGTELFLTSVDDLRDSEFAAPTLLPGWTRAHIIAHVHYNAEALRRLLRWAATGTEERMYKSLEQRAKEIEAGAQLAPEQLRQLVTESAGSLTTDIAKLASSAWQREIISAQGRTITATQIPWMRSREVCVHAVDLNAGVKFADLPADFTTALAVEVAQKRGSGHEGAALVAWLTGRAASPLPLDPWL